MVRHPFYFPANTVLLVITGLLIGSMALLADLIVRSRVAAPATSTDRVTRLVLAPDTTTLPNHQAAPGERPDVAPDVAAAGERSEVAAAGDPGAAR